MSIRVFLTLIAFWSSQVWTAEVAFLQIRRPDGSWIQLEPDGRFAHVAIRVGELWLHAHPHRGVDMVGNLTSYGHQLVVLRSPEQVKLDKRTIRYWLGRPFDHSFQWNNREATYCARLVADLLHVPPQVMFFRSDVWRNNEWPVGQLGLSPDELYAELVKRGYKPINSCEGVLVN